MHSEKVVGGDGLKFGNVGARNPIVSFSLRCHSNLTSISPRRGHH